MPYVLAPADEAAVDLRLVGGKGSSLARMTQAGFPVPPARLLTTDAYRATVAENELEREILDRVAAIDFDDATAVEAEAAKVRAAIEAAPIPEDVAAAAVAGYRDLGADSYVAVRSSGTAEDLAEASFAGQHDTYLDVRGEEELLDAVRRCWASMWTARATAYRHQRGFDQAEVALAVVVQTMIESEVSGVLFTANPVSGAVDEYVVNAAWGLGEGIVSGILTPDEFVLDRATMEVRRSSIGSKAVRIVRDPSGRGTTEEEVPASERAQTTLDPAQLSELGHLARRVTEFAGEWPQDIEWAYASGEYYLLQSRDVTGAELSWDEDLEEHTALPPLRPDDVLSRAWTDAVWQGRITPLGYSVRAETYNQGVSDLERMWGVEKAVEERLFKYHKGCVYINSKDEFNVTTYVLPPTLRSPLLYGFTPPSWLTDLDSQPGSWLNVAKVMARIQMLDPEVGAYSWFDHAQKQIDEDHDLALGLSPEQLRQLPDVELKREVQRTFVAAREWMKDLWTGFFVHVPFATAALMWMLENWYDGDNAHVFTDLITGLPEATITLKENVILWELAEEIRGDEELRAIYDGSDESDFLDRLRDSERGRTFLEGYDRFAYEYGHRGHADRDIWHLRRSETAAIDYRNFGVLLNAESDRPGAGEAALIAKREAATADVEDSLRRGSFGSLKVQLFRLAHDYLLRFYVVRDNERHHFDRFTFAKKRAVQELGRRCIERGYIEAAADGHDHDYYYLSKEELYRLLAGDTHDLRVVRAKVAARRRNCERYRKEWQPPMYIHGDGSLYEEPAAAGVEAAETEEGVFTGVPTARGEVVGRARVVPSQEGLGEVQKGDILVTHSTDPGWTPVFLVLSGLVLETGGLLAHGSCISREYGIPAVQLDGAMGLIEDGATISVNGDTGEIRVLAGAGEEAPVPVASEV